MDIKVLNEILNNPKDELTWDGDRLLVFHASPDGENLQDAYNMGGFVPGYKAGAMYGPGLYTNICAQQVVKCKYGPYVHAFTVPIKNPNVLAKTYIIDPLMYQVLYGKEPTETYLADQLLDRKDSGGNFKLEQDTIDYLTKIGREVLSHGIPVSFQSHKGVDWESTGERLLKTTPVKWLQRRGFKNIIYFGGNDHLCFVSWTPRMFCEHIASFIWDEYSSGMIQMKSYRDKRVEYIRNKKFSFIKESNLEQEDIKLGRMIELVTTGLIGTVETRAAKVFGDLPNEEKIQLVDRLQEIFKNDEYAHLWMGKFINGLNIEK